MPIFNVEKKTPINTAQLTVLLDKAQEAHDVMYGEVGPYELVSVEVGKLLQSIKTAAAKQPTKALVLELEQVLINTTLLLNQKMSPENYKGFANKIVEGKYSTPLMIIGRIMLALSAAAIAAFAFALITPLQISAVTLGAIAVTTGVSSGLCFFNARQKSVSKAASDLQVAVVKGTEAALPDAIARGKVKFKPVLEEILSKKDAKEETKASSHTAP